MSKWIEFEGTVCPFDDDTHIEVILNNGDCLSKPAGEFYWNLTDESPECICHVRVVEEKMDYDLVWHRRVTNSRIIETRECWSAWAHDIARGKITGFRDGDWLLVSLNGIDLRRFLRN